MTESYVDPHADVCEFEHLQEFVGDPRVPYHYSPEVGHGIPRVPTVAADGWWDDPDLIVVSFCPWCGRRLEPVES